jgi:AraC family transcriptional regulator
MKAVAETIAALGTPLFLNTVGNTNTPKATVARWRHNGFEATSSPSDTVRLIISLKSNLYAHHKSAAASRGGNINVGSVTFMPAALSTRVVVEGQSDVLHIFLQESILKAAASGGLKDVGVFDSHDSVLQSASMQLLVAARRGDPDDALLFETGVHHLAACLPQQYAEPAATTRGGMSPAACRRVRDLVVASLENCGVPLLTLDQMAEAAGFSVNHFIRIFRQQTGVTPHRYMVLRRLERGIDLLRTPRPSIAEVADGLGFATPAHFVATFRRTMGVTPGALRTALCG